PNSARAAFATAARRSRSADPCAAPELRTFSSCRSSSSTASLRASRKALTCRSSGQPATTVTRANSTTRARTWCTRLPGAPCARGRPRPGPRRAGAAPHPHDPADALQQEVVIEQRADRVARRARALLLALARVPVELRGHREPDGPLLRGPLRDRLEGGEQ